MIDLAKHVILITLEPLIILLHSCGLYLLSSLHRNDRLEVGHIYIMNLSVTEIVMNLCYLILYITRTINEYHQDLFDVKLSDKYILLIIQTMVAFSYYASMYIITIDKALDVRLSIQYPVYCTFARARHVVAGTWVIGGAIFIGIALSEKFAGFKSHKSISYAHITLNIGFIVVAILSYTYIFIKFKQTRDIPTATSSSANRNNQNIFQVFRNSRFFVAGLLILTFLCLVVLPDLLFYFNQWQGKAVSTVAVTLTHLSFATDGAIYIFMDRLVLGRLKKKVRNLRLVRFIGSKMTYRATTSTSVKHVGHVNSGFEGMRHVNTGFDGKTGNEEFGISGF